MIKVKNHQIDAIIRVPGALKTVIRFGNNNYSYRNKPNKVNLTAIKTYFGAISEPCCSNAPIQNHIELANVN